MTTTWVLLLLLTTQQIVVLDMPSEERCRYVQASINEGNGTIALLNGIRLPVAEKGALACMTETEFEAKHAKQGGGA